MQAFARQEARIALAIVAAGLVYAQAKSELRARKARKVGREARGASTETLARLVDQVNNDDDFSERARFRLGFRLAAKTGDAADFAAALSHGVDYDDDATRREVAASLDFLAQRAQERADFEGAVHLYIQALDALGVPALELLRDDINDNDACGIVHNLGTCFVEAGDTAAARKVFNRGLAMCPFSEDIQARLEELEAGALGPAHYDGELEAGALGPAHYDGEPRAGAHSL